MVRYVDSVYCDTLIVHDTIVLDPQVGLERVEATPLRVYLSPDGIVVEGAAAGELVSLYDMQGRLLEQRVATGGKTMLPAPARGVYLLRAGTRAGRKMVVN